MSAELPALLDSDPAAGILRTADLREQLAEAFRAWWEADRHNLADYIVAETNPAHALAAVRRWRGVVERHRKTNLVYVGSGTAAVCDWCDGIQSWPCPDLAETADEARAYLAGTP